MKSKWIRNLFGFLFGSLLIVSTPTNNKRAKEKKIMNEIKIIVIISLSCLPKAFQLHGGTSIVLFRVLNSFFFL